MSFSVSYDELINILAFSMLIMAMMISMASTVSQMIPLYRIQSGILTLIVILTGLSPVETYESNSRVLILLLFALIPILLILAIEPLLAQATVAEVKSGWRHILLLFRKDVRDNIYRRALPVWLSQQFSYQHSILSIVVDLILIILAFVTAFSIEKKDPLLASILAISLSLLLLGLSIMRSKHDIISQIMGLLVMEHGMFLAAIRIISSPVIVITFVVGLFLYIAITLTILVVLLPDLHRISNTIEIDQQDHLQG
ncbi:MAG: hypothetical protein GYA36_21065 [Veillonellaceae bacterium]|jgi:hydrogenase-4 membrane subunit HyfE|nr:hypothetical protein [Veillonellaceae bacterium]